MQFFLLLQCSSSVGDVEHFSSIFVDVYEDKCFFAKTSAFLFRKKNYAQKYVHVNINILMCSYILNIILVICKKKCASVMIGSSICFHTKYTILFLTMWFLQNVHLKISGNSAHKFVHLTCLIILTFSICIKIYAQYGLR